jgi:hypothetical protein
MLALILLGLSEGFVDSDDLHDSLSLLQLNRRVQSQQCDSGGLSEPARSAYEEVTSAGACANGLLASTPDTNMDSCFASCQGLESCGYFHIGSGSNPCSLFDIAESCDETTGSGSTYRLAANPVAGVSQSPLTPPFSVSARIRTDQEGTQYVMAWGNFPNRALVLGPTSQLYYSECCAPNSARSRRIQTSPDLADGQWHTVAVTRDVGGDVKLYIDGSEAASGNIPFEPQEVPEEWQSCRPLDDSCATTFDGEVTSIRQYDSVLSAAEVSEIQASC